MRKIMLALKHPGQTGGCSPLPARTTSVSAAVVARRHHGLPAVRAHCIEDEPDVQGATLPCARD